MGGLSHSSPSARGASKDEKLPLLQVNEVPSKQTSYVEDQSKDEGLGHTYPKKEAGWISSIFFSWITPLMQLGNKRTLQHEDLYQLDPSNRATHVSEDFQEAWNQQLAKAPGSKPSLAIALLLTYGGHILRAGILKLIHDSLQFVAPMMIQRIIAFLKDPEAPLSEGLLYATLVFFAGIGQSFSLRNYFFLCYEAGLRIRTAICTSVYRKSLVLSATVQNKRSSGEITNLMSVDANRLQELTTYGNSIWYAPFQIVVSLVLLWQQLGVSTLAGVAVIILMLPVTAGMSRIMRSLQQKLMKIKDTRLKICGEVLAGMKVIKFQAWENSFTKSVMSYRNSELERLRTYIYARSGAMTVFSAIPSLVTVSSFMTYVLLGNTLDVGTALTSLALFNILRFPLNMLPQVVNSFVEAGVSVDRLSAFLMEEEHQKVGSGNLTEVGIEVKEADFVWDSDPAQAQEGETTESANTDSEEGAKTPVLRQISLSARAGELIAVVGHVGSGKSTLISGILGNARATHGDVAIKGQVAYVSQQPFIQNASVRENICFGADFDEKRYQKAIEVSSLKSDLEILPAGDATEIGEKGINLSGGQRTRVSIARAVYQDADVYLLDDILSAVDSHVGRDIFTDCIKDALKDKLVVLVTHGLTFLNQCDRVLVIDHGVIAEQGSYDHVMSQNGILNELVSNYQEQDTKADDEAEEEAEGDDDDYDAPQLERKASRRSRASSTHSNKTNEDEDPSSGKLITDEDRSIGDVAWHVYKVYADSFGGPFVAALIMSTYILMQLVNLASTWWLSYWSESAGTTNHSQLYYLYIFIALNLAYTVVIFIRSISTLVQGLRASRVLFEALFSRILRAPSSFFDTTPSGRIMNRLSKDVYTVDESLPSTYAMLLNTSFSVIVTLCIVSYVTPMFMIILVPVIIGYYRSQRYFIKTNRELQRLDSISRSPVYALLGETLDGLPTIRAYDAESKFNARYERILDRNQRAYFLYVSTNCWLALRLEFAGTLVAAFAAYSAVLAHPTEPEGSYFAGQAGVSLSYAFSVTQALNWSVRMLSQLQTQMVSVERIETYSQMPVEAQLTVPGAVKPEWPTEGEIEFDRVNLRYRPGLPRVLRNLTMTIKSKEKIGIVGRTGAGKSSLVVALMRLVELDSGAIRIDGADISKMGLHDLRKKISIIPQDPVLFSGTVRSNLDPFDEYSDDQLWTSLRRAHLRGAVTALDANVDERGSNFSVGERQLLCIARALLKRSRIILMDEATASIDTETDRKIQESIRTEFKECTTLTVAHRINTILDSDRILVMEKGAVGEFDTPAALQRKPDGLFKALVSHWRNEDN